MEPKVEVDAKGNTADVKAEVKDVLNPIFSIFSNEGPIDIDNRGGKEPSNFVIQCSIL